jgi:integrase
LRTWPATEKRIRTVPMPSWAKAAIDVRTAAAGITTGLVFRSLAKGGRITDRITSQAVFALVRWYGLRIGVPALAPHDLRRRHAKLARRGKAAFEQIQLSLGNSLIITTERYLGCRQGFADAPCDYLGLDVSCGENA